ncbi:ABC transporter ATP-binding protein [Sulfolobus acidocaldarius]|uniref:ABC transporter n=4 Tax=Sulfolobus acidocaldarius TaxID=2285 RepID=Q4J8N6_SULAC|nr:ABC transporter ATP-binding protein [Sulfolobus acidocaldarius]AAY80850.1 ABC transporter [Sulfolobus acidocaldarius DSM 639]AGE71450.1 ABC transporter [Sulfolobus acidocaldarius N8]AGE73723.1 ABC transporter [Sulfolobus acidocaldarius Ron12/I]ALU30314.1 multidrug ABC transporter ATP-binding protein [Sulfolobus acidocaldarius]ALU31032.1 multidrug ABC transporter ATP-binding protein [Sulfolobus acidocaldarius]
MLDCIEVDGLIKFYGSFKALDGLAFYIKCGEKVALLGPNGAGKTTTLRILAGLLRPNEGIVKIKGFDISKNPREAKSNIGFLPEDAVPFLNLTVRENLEYVGILRNINNLKERINHLLDVLELWEYERKTVSSLSRGNRQKVALAMAIIHEPAILLLDEPLNYLDIPTQERVINLLNSMNSTMLVSTHIMSIAERLTNKIILITKGKVIWQGGMTELKKLAGENERIEQVVARLIGDSL